MAKIILPMANIKRAMANINPGTSKAMAETNPCWGSVNGDRLCDDSADPVASMSSISWVA